MKRTITGITLVAALVATSVMMGKAQVWYGRGNASLPQGSYQQSCINASMRGSVLSASCTNPSGQRIYSSLDVSRCAGVDIGNINGYLSCSGGNRYGNNGYRGQWNRGDRDNDRDDRNYRRVPGGSYLQTCSNARVNGQELTADCTNDQGYSVTTSLNFGRCGPGSDIGNVNGRLRCVYNR